MSEENEYSFAGKSILIAEDNLDNQDLMRDVLEMFRYKLDVANDGAEAVEKWKKNRYDLIIMDIQMPNMDGFQAAREIRKLENGRNRIPILALTASVLTNDIQECFKAGMDDYVSKPINLDDLEKKIYGLLLKVVA